MSAPPSLAATTIAPPERAEESLLGRSVPRVEDHDLLTGEAKFVDDVDQPRQVHARLVRSPVAHARITAIDFEEAARQPGVLGVFTAADLPDVRVPIRMLASAEAEAVLQPPLARGVVRYVGEPVALVVAESQYLAEDAAELVELDFEPLPVVLDPVAASETGSQELHAELGGNVVNQVRGVHGVDFETLRSAAAVVVTERLQVERHTAVPLETRGLLAEVEPGTDRLLVWGPAKVKHFNRWALAQMLGIEEARIQFVEPSVGGGFGVRGEFYPEDFLIPWAALRLRRPVKWIEDRAEHFVAANHAREQVCEIEMAASSDGTLLGFRARCWINQGAYARTHGGVLLPLIAIRHLGGPYAWKGFEAEALSVLTNKTPSGTYRGPSQYEPTFFRERMIDRLAVELELDPAELRRRNLIRGDQLPYRADLGETTLALEYESGDYELVWDRLTEAADYDELVAGLERRRRRGEVVGVGLAAYLEEGGFGAWEEARAVPERDGTFTLQVGVASVGQGVRTALGQIAADALGIAMERVRIVHDDTDEVVAGLGAFGSRTTILGGGAVLGAIADLERALREAAAQLLEVDAADVRVDFAAGVCRAGEDAVTPLAELDCVGRHRFEKNKPGFSMGAHLAVVSIDRETEDVAVERVIVCHDVGRMVNPMMVDGQIAGAAAQGVAGALFEELPYDEAGQPLATSFMDYLMPTAVEVPPVEAEILELADLRPAAGNPFGLKGAGESGIVGIGGAVANAVADALGRDRRAALVLPIRLDRHDLALPSAPSQTPRAPRP